MNVLLFTVVVGLWSIEGIRDLRKTNHKAIPKIKANPHRKHKNHVATYKYIDGVAYEDIPGGWTLKA